MYINTRMSSSYSKDNSGGSLGNAMIHLEYSDSIRKRDETSEMIELRKKIVKKNKKGDNVEPLIEKYKQLEEEVFVQRNGMGSIEFAQKQEEEYRSLTTEPRECLCTSCMGTFNSDKQHPICVHCGNGLGHFSERVTDSDIVGKTIVSVYRGREEDYIFLSDGSHLIRYLGPY